MILYRTSSVSWFGVGDLQSFGQSFYFALRSTDLADGGTSPLTHGTQGDCPESPMEAAHVTPNARGFRTSPPTP